MQEELLALARTADQRPDDDRARLRADIELHTALVRLANCHALVDHFVRIANAWFFHHVSLITAYPSAPADEHVKLIRDLCELDRAQVADRIRAHIHVGKQKLIGDVRHT